MEAYNGWTNYPTWCVNLWLTNDQSTEEWVREIVTEEFTHAMHEAPFSDTVENEKYAVSVTADTLADNVKDMIETQGISFDGMAGDLLSYAFGQVNWNEITRAFMEQ